jgi:hypothetical protein
MSQGEGAPGAEGAAQSGCQGWQQPPQSKVDDIGSWGFNSVRFAISWANLEPVAPTIGPNGQLVHHWNMPYVTAVDQVVDQLHQNGVAAILEMAQANWSPAFSNVQTRYRMKCQGSGMPVWLYPNPQAFTVDQARIAFYQDSGNIQDQYAAAWTFVAQRYSQNPTVVGFDVFNEPYGAKGLTPPELNLNGMYQRVCSAIRAVNSRALLIFEDTGDRGNGLFGLTSPPPFSGEVYSFHLYTSDWIPDGLARVQDYYQRAAAWNVPLWIGEFDVFHYASPGVADPNWQRDLQEMLAYCQARDIGWSIFTLSPGWFLDPRTGYPKAGLLAALQSDF